MHLATQVAGVVPDKFEGASLKLKEVAFNFYKWSSSLGLCLKDATVKTKISREKHWLKRSLKTLLNR
jgi:hypothetical protein